MNLDAVKERVEWRMTLHVRHLTDEQAKELPHQIDEAICLAIGRPSGSASNVVTPDFDGPGRTVEEQARATREGRR